MAKRLRDEAQRRPDVGGTRTPPCLYTATQRSLITHQHATPDAKAQGADRHRSRQALHSHHPGLIAAIDSAVDAPAGIRSRGPSSCVLAAVPCRTRGEGDVWTDSDRGQRDGGHPPRVRACRWLPRALGPSTTGWAAPHRTAARAGRPMADPHALAEPRSARHHACRFRTASRPGPFRSVEADPSLEVLEIEVHHFAATASE